MTSLEQLKLKLPTNPAMWSVTVSLNNRDVNFKIDAGADVTVILESILKKLDIVELQPCSRCLSGPCQKNLEVCGQFTGVM